MVIIPEEAELIIPLVYENKTAPTHLLTYSAPVMRRMLHFNRLDYYAMPALPTGWKAPTWLVIELGIFAGRLYFEYDEYDDLRKYLGLREGGAVLAGTTDKAAAPVELSGTAGPVDDAADKTEIDTRTGQVQSLTTKPLAFLQEWLAMRRKGQDFMHTPMGYVCQGKSLTENHPFFSRVANDGAIITEAANMRNGARLEENASACSSGEDFASDKEVAEDDEYGNDDEDEYGMLDESEPE